METTKNDRMNAMIAGIVTDAHENGEVPVLENLDLSHTRITDQNLQHAILRGCNLVHTTFDRCDLRCAIIDESNRSCSTVFVNCHTFDFANAAGNESHQMGCVSEPTWPRSREIDSDSSTFISIRRIIEAIQQLDIPRIASTSGKIVTFMMMTFPVALAASFLSGFN